MQTKISSCWIIVVSAGVHTTDMFKSRTAIPVGANSVCDSNEVEKFALTSHKSTWAPIVFFLGPCFSLKKVQFGRPVEHINYRDTARLYESIPTETGVLVWSNAAHEGTIKSLKQTIVHGTSMLDRLQSELCSEMKVCALYFNQRITKKEFQEEMRLLIANDFVYESFQMALRRMRNEKIAFKLTNTLQLFIPEIQSEARMESITKLKWAVKYNPEVISFDEGNLQVDAFDIQDALMFAHKYGRKIRIARWGEEIPEVPLCELLYRSLVDFLQTGRYVDSEYVARARTFAENKSLNGLNQLATAEDIAFDHGYVLDKDGFITKLHKPLTPSVLGKKFFVSDLFRPKKAVSPAAMRAEKDIKSPRRVSSFLSAITSKTSAESAPDDYHTIERQIQRELGLTETVVTPAAATTAAGSVVIAETGTIIGKGSEGEGSLALIVAEAARNAQQVRRETNWVAFLNHKVPSSVTATYIRSKKGVSLPHQSQTPSAPAVSTRVEGSAQPDVLAGLGSYTYGLGAKKPYKPAQSGAADATAATGQKDVWVETTEVSAPPPVSTKTKEVAIATTLASPKEVKVSVSPEPAPHKDVPYIRASYHPPPTPPAPAPAPVQQTPPSVTTSVRVENIKNKKLLTIVVPELPTESDGGEIQEIRKDGINEKQSEQRADEKADQKATVSPKTDAPLSFTTTNSATTNTTQSIDTKDTKYTAESPVVCAPTSVPVVPVTIPASAPSFRTPDSIVLAASAAAVAQQQAPLVSQAMRPVPSIPTLSPSSRFSPRARLIPTLSDESLILGLTSTSTSAGIKTVSDNLKGEDSAVETIDQVAEQAVAAALEKASAFRSRDVTPVAATAAKGAAPGGVASQPMAKVLHRPVPRAPSAMNMQMASRPLPAPPLLPARVPPAPMVVPVTVREKKDVIERRIRSQRAPPAVCRGSSPTLKDSTHLKRSPHQQQNTDDKMASQDIKSTLVDQDGTAIKPSARTAPVVGLNDNAHRKTDEEEANQPVLEAAIKPMTQKSLQKKWAFITITQHQSGVN